MKDSTKRIIIVVGFLVVALVLYFAFANLFTVRPQVLEQNSFAQLIERAYFQIEDGQWAYQKDVNDLDGDGDTEETLVIDGIGPIRALNANMLSTTNRSYSRITYDAYTVTLYSANGQPAFTTSWYFSGEGGFAEWISRIEREASLSDASVNLIPRTQLSLTGVDWTGLITSGIFLVLMIVLFAVMMRQMSGGGSKTMNFGRVKTKANDNVKVRFSDVAGAEEEKEELKEIVEFLKTPKKFSELGARIPKGVLLVGPPGTGKTLFAKAVAGEANVPFFSISGSDFVEMFVGVGASRVRDLFDIAKKSMPCIVFIDEIDAVGRQRGTGLGGGHDEREQTLNQLLVQMDGFESNDGIIVMAATNRADVLDPALLRPGRFDRQITVNPPDVRGREEIFKVHARNKPLSPEINFRNLARLTSGFTGADIENLLNEAAIFAARASRKQIIMKDIYEAFNKVIAGPAKKSRLVTEADKRITAYHEAGHAITAKCLKHADSVHEVTIIPRGNAGGYTMFRPKNDDVYTSKNKWLDQISISLGGRVAEELVIQDITPGAVGDLQQCSAIARKMVSEWGMSKLGPVYYGTEHEVFLGRDFQPQHTYSEEVAKEVDEEIKSIIDSCYKRTHEILEGKLDILHNMAKLLIERETIISSDVDMLMNGASVEEVAKAMDERQAREQRDSAGQNAAQPPARKDPPAPTSSSAEPPSADPTPSDPFNSSDSSELPH